ncbi:peptidase-like protein [Parathielavia appendiculata]|uniref:Peptide hydrolase n=1 Tax=Parathielavia appendiculata TaxID=2587402 RepID=A0AAN6TSS7_9PEZI|nr:peptidase-like protein [Parathielavia appendiculata]
MKLTRITLAALRLSSTAVATNNILTADKFEADIRTEELQNVLWNLNKIARDNGGNRAFGEPGFRASLDFVLERAQKRFGDRFDTFVQPFNHTYDKTLRINVTGPAGEDVFVISPMYNPATPLPGGITAGLVDTPVDDERGSGCFAEQWDGVDATGKLALIKRGVCAVADKLKLAKEHGALGVILYNQEPGTSIAVPTLGAETIGQTVPVGIIPLEVGENWRARLASRADVVVTLLVDSISETRETWNIISETKQGDPNKVVMLGAHLDSVQKGAGINDDGSGVAALLEIMTALRRYDGFPHKIRFAWWGAEESGLVGSLYYTSHLSEAEADKIKYYFNYDMIGSPQPDFSIASNNNSGIGPELFEEYLVSQGVQVRHGGFDTGSDYVGFVNIGVPTIALHTGAGAPWDACYHQACDDLDNIHWEALTVNAKAAARALVRMAHSLEGVPPRQKTSLNLRTRRGVAESFAKWAAMAEEASHGHSCSHKGKKLRV